MKRILFICVGLCIIVGITNAQTFTLTSKSLGGQATKKQLFNGFGCDGQNVSPQLSWVNVPEGTNSFAVTMYDPDAPTGSGWWHWVVFDIPSNINELVEGAGDISKDLAPKGCVQSNTDIGQPGFGGPCPAEGSGFHQYIVTVYALKCKNLGLDNKSGPALVGSFLNQNVIEKSSLIFYYKR